MPLATLAAYPFRIFFLSAAALAVLVVPAWLALLLGGGGVSLAFAPLHWHQHEMLFGFLHAAIAGFLLTAVCNWTGTERLHGGPLLALWGVWIAARLLMAAGAGAPGWLVHGVDLAFLPLVMLDAGRRIHAARQPRHWIVLAVLGALWALEIAFHVYPAGPYARAALLAAMLLMLVIGGRITPAFSGNWLRLQGRDAGAVRVIPWLERATLAAVALVLVTQLLPTPGPLAAAAAVAAAGASAARLLLWRGWLVRGEPLLWILHVALAWIPLTLLLLAAAELGYAPPSAWVHAAGAGAMGALILGVMARVALGHTGRALRLPRGMTAAFVLVLAAGAIRVGAAAGVLPWREALIAAGAAWTLAFAIFLARYAPILAAPRADGKPG
jgi:uncharacterized protein involved in response to NO